MKTNKLENILNNAKLDYSSLMLLNIYNTYELANFLKDKLSDNEYYHDYDNYWEI